ncbi:MAG: Obg family GTPase CgtA, partial [Candidatus Microbacterium stercoravium]
AVAHRGLRELTFALAELVSAERARIPEAPPAERVVIRPKRSERDFTIRAEDSPLGPLFRILGAKPERWVQQTDFKNDEAVGYLADRLEKLGIENALVRAGATPGAAVVIGEGDGVVFDWDPAISSAAELAQAPRGTDPRLEGNQRRTTTERREAYKARQDARTIERALEEERRLAGSASEAENPDVTE